MTTLNFLYPFRKYQRMILAQVEQAPKDHKYHIVAPPGAGKTIVGIELINRLGMPAVVFAPTTTIQAQWKDKVGMFLADPAGANQITSLDSRQLADINIYTYQLISTPGEEQEREAEIALQEWVQELLREGQSSDEAAALTRIETLRENNPASYRSEIAKRYKRAKRKLLTASPAELERFLHPNARELIARLVRHGVRTIVLDECHHLLDYWALTLRYLISQLPDPHIIGLTATLPSPETDEEYDNYTSLLGDVDFEVPTPAVVKEGDLAPYRDLVYFVEPSQREMDYLNNIQSAFEQAISELTKTPRFRDWVAGFLRPSQSEDEWRAFCSQSPLFSLACIHFARAHSLPIAPELLLPIEAEDPITIEDWALLLEKFGLNVLKISPDTSDHQLFERLRKILLPFGFTITERGLRQSRSVGDLVLTFSENKDHAVADILQKEHAVMAEHLRAVVVTDFERMSSGIQTLSGVLDKDAGSALRLFHHLAEHPGLGALSPVLLTGKTFMVTKENADSLLTEFNRYIEHNRLHATCRALPPKAGNVVEVVGEGADWASRTYVRMATELFDRGVVRCLIGTRGILGEGWDSLTLNTLIDLTSVTTSTSVQQLRGRTIRKDPAWARKVAHNWDVVCVAKRFQKGSVDLNRLIARHGRYWGIVVTSQFHQVIADVEAMSGALTSQVLPSLSTSLTMPRQASPNSPLAPEQIGRVVKGLAHVDAQLAYDLTVKEFKHVNYQKYTRRMLAAASERDRTYNLWGVGQEYSNFSYSASRLDTRDLKIRTVFSMGESIKRMLREFIATILSGTLMVLTLACRMSLSAAEADLGLGLLCLAIILGFGTFGVFLFNLWGAYKIFQKLLVNQPVDAILLDVARALFFSLRENGLVSRNLQPDYLRVIEQPDNSYEVLLDYASPEDAATFIKAFVEIFDPVRDQRYLILRTDERLPNLIFMPFWLGLRNFLVENDFTRPTYHPVPQVLSTRKELAQVFATYWQKYVGGGQLIFTRSEIGRNILLQARAQRRPKVKGMAFELWR
ncbi:MAG: DEAD/DEAH box helicase family protein [Anaerolineae bacterium]|nr:DEAD/DEAH box helicase family protein [Anaerolineae bacterium]